MGAGWIGLVWYPAFADCDYHSVSLLEFLERDVD
jgi:hypothetical protein